MELIKKIDKIEVVGEDKIVQVRELVCVMEGEELISSSYNRYILAPNVDITDQPEEVKGICDAAWTDEIKSTYTEKQAKIDADFLKLHPNAKFA